MSNQAAKMKGTAGVLGYATPEGRSRRQSWWGIVSLICGAVAGSMMVMAIIVYRGPYGMVSSTFARWFSTLVLLTIVGSVPAGIVTGIVGLAQRKRGREMAMYGLALCMPVLFISAWIVLGIDMRRGCGG